MTIIITGGAGFIGSNFVYHMLDAHPDYQIVYIDKLTYAGNLSTLAPLLDEQILMHGVREDENQIWKRRRTLP